MRKRNWVIAVAALVILAVILMVRFKPFGHKQEVTYRTEPVQLGDVTVQVSATGTLNAVTTVQVGSQVSGTISALYVDFNDRVREGQVLAQLDPTFLKAQVAQSEADLEKTEVQVKQAERDYARQKPLEEQGLASQANIDAAETTLEAAKASEKSAEAALDRAKTNLQYATIRSPIDGIVVSRNVDVGQTVAASLSAPTLFTIANDLAHMQLEAAVDEADIGMVRVGQKVSFTVDAFPDRTFEGVVYQIRLAPETIQNVVSYTVIVHVENREQNLLPGMTANATFLIDQARDVLKVPVAALRFRPPRMLQPESGGSGARAAGAPAGMEGGGGPAGWQREGSTRPGMGAGPAVFVLEPGDRIRRIPVRTGLSDGTFTAVSSDSLRAGMPVVVSSSVSAGGDAPGTVNPFMPGMRRRGRR